MCYLLMYFERSSLTFYDCSVLSQISQKNDRAEQDFCVYNQYYTFISFVFMQIEESQRVL